MPNNCVQAVVLVGEILGKLAHFCALSTARFDPKVICTNLVHNLSTICAQAWPGYPHKTLLLSPPCFFGFYTFPTGPINTTKLIKE
jgi:hypothetical protein